MMLTTRTANVAVNVPYILTVQSAQCTLYVSASRQLSDTDNLMSFIAVVQYEPLRAGFRCHEVKQMHTVRWAFYLHWTTDCWSVVTVARMSGGQSFYHCGNIVLPSPFLDWCVFLIVSLFNSSFETDVTKASVFHTISKHYVGCLVLRCSLDTWLSMPNINSTFQIIYNVLTDQVNGQYAWHPHYCSKCLLIPQFVKTNRKHITVTHL